MVKVCGFILYLYRHARETSEKNETYLVSLLSFMCTNTDLGHIPTVSYLSTSYCTFTLVNINSGCFHPEDPFSWSLHSPCHLFSLLLFCYTKHNLIAFYSTSIVAYSIVLFHSLVLLSICPSCQSLLQTVEFSSKQLHALFLTGQG